MFHLAGRSGPLKGAAMSERYNGSERENAAGLSPGDAAALAFNAKRVLVNGNHFRIGQNGESLGSHVRQVVSGD